MSTQPHYNGSGTTTAQYVFSSVSCLICGPDEFSCPFRADGHTADKAQAPAVKSGTQPSSTPAKKRATYTVNKCLDRANAMPFPTASKRTRIGRLKSDGDKASEESEDTK